METLISFIKTTNFSLASWNRSRTAVELRNFVESREARFSEDFDEQLV